MEKAITLEKMVKVGVVISEAGPSTLNVPPSLEANVEV